MAMSDQDMPLQQNSFQSKLRMDGRRVVVIGAGPGVGNSTVAALVELGARVVCVDRDKDAAEATAGLYEVTGLSCDVTDEKSFRSMVAEAESILGGVNGIVDVVGYSKMGRLSDFSLADWHKTFSGVVDHAFLTMTIGAEALSRSGGGSMCFVGSNSGLVTVKGQAAYGAAKAALHHLVAGMGAELGPRGIRVNAVAPGFIKNPSLERVLDEGHWTAVVERIPLGRTAVSQDVAGTILYLMSDLAAHVSAQVVTVDGASSRVLQLPTLPWNAGLS
ncbi:SDR family oxidoreductase (plasmid) [Rhodococcus sp. USK10]|uniref:SDR family NAD(P)-dependent oxidoreductase n=1 Tax=Rhodococcus sp. USK10 TaxID=2789739 RepID=UPI001C5DC145|nr:SDR family oxidoreductase [Rhodococcus sp. USK10]QYB00243.1 SDR family oxidoreductase [Rhodococcus sp. USK10]